MPAHEKIDYLEFPAKNLEATKDFFAKLFEWQFEDFGPDYSAIKNAGIDGGFYRAEVHADAAAGSVLVVFYSRELEKTLAKIVPAGGEIVKPIFSFPGGRRFHFSDPSGNEYAVWSEDST